MKRLRNKAGNVLSETKELRKPRRVRWYLLANRSSASIYENDHANSFNFVQKLSFSMGRLKDRIFNLDRPGKHMMKVGKGSVTHASERGFEHSKDLAKMFAKKIANFLEINENREQFNELVIVAEPRFLGILRKMLPPKIKKLVINEIDREYMADSKNIEADQVLRAIKAYTDFPRPSSPTYFYLTDRSPYPY